MNTISAIIRTLSTEEKRIFLGSLRQKNKRNDTKNIQLFKLLDTSETITDVDIKLYQKPAKGAYHALSKRLYDSLIDFVASKSFEGETSEEMEILKLLLASRIFFEQKQYKIGLKTLLKAEQKAKSYDLFTILNEIYYTKIQYAHTFTTPLETLIKAFKDNKAAIEQEESLNLFYASVKNKLLQQHSDYGSIIKKSLSEFGISIHKGLPFRSLSKILEIVNQTAQATRNYSSILPFVEETYGHIANKEKLGKKHLFYHIQILYYVANTYFRNTNFEKSLQYLLMMHSQMQVMNTKYHRRFFPQYNLLHCLNLIYTGHINNAITILEHFDSNRHKEQTTYILDLKLCQVVCYFIVSRFKDAMAVLKNFYHSDQWYAQKADTLWVIKKNLIEILLYIELDEIDLVASRVQSFRKKHSDYLKLNNGQMVLDFLKLIVAYYKNPEAVTQKKHIILIENLLKTSNRKNDIFEMSFYAWLKGKLDNNTLYQVILKIINPSLIT